MKNEHILYKDGDIDAPESIKDRNGDVVLDMRSVCGRAQSELEEPCESHAAVSSPYPEAWEEDIETLREVNDWLKNAISIFDTMDFNSGDVDMMRAVMSKTDATISRLASQKNEGLPIPLPVDGWEYGMNGREWARAFAQKAKSDWLTDEGVLIGWFASAIMAGFDEARRRYKPLAPDERKEN